MAAKAIWPAMKAPPTPNAQALLDQLAAGRFVTPVVIVGIDAVTTTGIEPARQQLVSVGAGRRLTENHRHGACAIRTGVFQHHPRICVFVPQKWHVVVNFAIQQQRPKQAPEKIAVMGNSLGKPRRQFRLTRRDAAENWPATQRPAQLGIDIAIQRQLADPGAEGPHQQCRWLKTPDLGSTPLVQRLLARLQVMV